MYVWTGQNNIFLLFGSRTLRTIWPYGLVWLQRERRNAMNQWCELMDSDWMSVHVNHICTSVTHTHTHTYTSDKAEDCGTACLLPWWWESKWQLHCRRRHLPLLPLTNSSLPHSRCKRVRQGDREMSFFSSWFASRPSRLLSLTDAEISSACRKLSIASLTVHAQAYWFLHKCFWLKRIHLRNIKRQTDTETHKHFGDVCETVWYVLIGCSLQWHLALVVVMETSLQ